MASSCLAFHTVLDCSLPEGFGVYLHLCARSHTRPNIRSKTSGLKECIIWVRKRDGQTGNPGEMCSVKGQNGRAGRQSLPASAGCSGQPAWGGRGGKSGLGASGLVGGSQAPATPGLFSCLPPPPAPHLLPGPLFQIIRYGQSEKGGSQPAAWVKARCVLKLGAEVGRGGSPGSCSDPGVIVV